jgi:hypothetical protein
MTVEEYEKYVVEINPEIAYIFTQEFKEKLKGDFPGFKIATYMSDLNTHGMGLWFESNLYYKDVSMEEMSEFEKINDQFTKIWEIQERIEIMEKDFKENSDDCKLS